MTRYSITGISKDQAIDAGATDIKTMRHTDVMFANMSEDLVRRLRIMGATVEPIQNVKTEDVSVPTPQVATQMYTIEQVIEMAGIYDLYKITSPYLSAQGINIAVLDTGIRETHQMINGRVVFRKNYTTDLMEDGYDHGTGIASVLVGVAPACNILDLKVLNNDGEGTTEEVIEAIDDCIDLWTLSPEIAPVLINLSIGAADTGNPNDPLRVACRAALENRIWIVAAAGNFGPSTVSITTPAVEEYVMAIGSVHPDTLEVSSFSSRGPSLEGKVKPDAVFFGENIQTAGASEDSALMGRSGTSFSAPFITGLLALYLEGVYAYRGTVQVAPNEYAVPVSMAELIENCISAMCMKPGDALVGKDNEYGYGIVSGTLMAQSIAGPTTQPDMGALIGAMAVVGMAGLMIKQISSGRE